MDPSTTWLTEAPPLAVSVAPEDSPYVQRVRRAAIETGATYVPVSAPMPPDAIARLLVVDLTSMKLDRRLGARVIAVCDRDVPGCFETIHPDEVPRHLGRAIRTLVEFEYLRARVEAERETIQFLNEIGFALSSTDDRHELLDAILTHARRVLRADGGTIYLLDGEALRFAAYQNDTVVPPGGRRDRAVSPTSLSAYVARTGEPMNIPDARAVAPSPDWAPDFTMDRETGYETRSMLVVPLLDRRGGVVGVLALYNHKAQAGVPLQTFDQVTPFGQRHVALARSIASQAAVALENQRLLFEIRNLFDGFISASVKAIESRDPTTGGHSLRVAELTRVLAEQVNESDDPAFRHIHFTTAELRELHYAALLHDFGKVGVRENVLLKAERLYPWESTVVDLRFQLAALEVRLRAALDGLGTSAIEADLSRLEADLQLVRRLNRAGLVSDADRGALAEVATRWRVGGQLGSEPGPILSDREVVCLGVRRGTLAPDEREEIERHVSETRKFLSEIPWTRDLRNVPDLAGSHHEKLDGSGYPRRLRGDAIPPGAQLMAIADIWDALVATDRPYKTAMPHELALRILRDEAEDGKLRAEAVELFASRRVWELVG